MDDGEDLHFIWKKSCDSCRKIKKTLDTWGVPYTSREMNAAPLTEADVEAIIGLRPVKPFLNTRNQVYREHNLAQRTPGHDEAIRLISETNNLLKRPILMRGEERILGNHLDEMAQLVGRGGS